LELNSPQKEKVGGDDKDRTCDIQLAKLALSQLSYTPTINLREANLVDLARICQLGSDDYFRII
jgi:hypothetical protein